MAWRALALAEGMQPQLGAPSASMAPFDQLLQRSSMNIETNAAILAEIRALSAASAASLNPTPALRPVPSNPEQFLPPGMTLCLAAAGNLPGGSSSSSVVPPQAQSHMSAVPSSMMFRQQPQQQRNGSLYEQLVEKMATLSLATSQSSGAEPASVPVPIVPRESLFAEALQQHQQQMSQVLQAQQDSLMPHQQQPQHKPQKSVPSQQAKSSSDLSRQHSPVRQPQRAPQSQRSEKRSQQNQESRRQGARGRDDTKVEDIPRDPVHPPTDTLRAYLQALRNEDPERVFVARKINKLGFHSRVVLRRHYSKYGRVAQVFVSHSKVKPYRNHDAPHRTRPGNLGLVVMRTTEAARRVLAEGTEQIIEGVPITVHMYDRLKMDWDCNSNTAKGEESSVTATAASDAGFSISNYPTPQTVTPSGDMNTLTEELLSLSRTMAPSSSAGLSESAGNALHLSELTSVADIDMVIAQLDQASKDSEQVVRERKQAMMRQAQFFQMQQQQLHDKHEQIQKRQLKLLQQVIHSLQQRVADRCTDTSVLLPPRLPANASAMASTASLAALPQGLGASDLGASLRASMQVPPSLGMGVPPAPGLEAFSPFPTFAGCGALGRQPYQKGEFMSKHEAEDPNDSERDEGFIGDEPTRRVVSKAGGSSSLESDSYDKRRAKNSSSNNGNSNSNSHSNSNSTDDSHEVDEKFAANQSLRVHLIQVQHEDPLCIFVARRINKLGFRARSILHKHFSRMGEVSRVLVASSKVKPFRDPNGQLRTRPGGFGLIVMTSREPVRRILALGADQVVAGHSIRIQHFQHPENLDVGFSGSSGSTKSGDSTTEPAKSTSQGSGSSGSSGRSKFESKYSEDGGQDSKSSGDGGAQNETGADPSP